VIVVTGASSGLGRAVARLAGRRGAKVVVTARTAEALDACVREIEAFGAEALAVPGDCTVQDDVAQVVERAVDRFGRIDTYIANAIVTVYAETYRYEPDELRRIMDVNFFESARVELMKDRYGVDISVVHPAAINTPQFDRDRQKIGKQPQPVPPIYQPEPFADAVLHCCEHPIRELPIGWGAQKLMWGQKLSPRAGDLMLLRMGWKGQHTDDDKPLDSPDNLFGPMPGDPGAHGRFDAESRNSTLWTSLRLRRWLVGAAMVGAAAVAGSVERNRRTGLLR